MLAQKDFVKGIDVSKWQGEIDWKKAAASGVRFAMIRGAYGCSEDTCFRRNMEGARSAGVDVGVYQYSIASGVKEAEREAEFMTGLLRPYNLQYPAVMDVEDQKQAGLGKKEMTDLVFAYADILKKAGYYPALYASSWWLQNRFDSRIGKLDLWTAQWGSRLTFPGETGIWQYTSSGSAGGISAAVDLNISFVNYPRQVLTAGGKWEKNEKGWWYRLKDGSFAASEWLRLNGRWYWFDERGYAVTGLRQIDGQPYYFAEKNGKAGGTQVYECQCLFTSDSGAVQHHRSIFVQRPVLNLK